MGGIFLKIKKDNNQNVWCISSEVELDDKYKFLILCPTEDKAKETLSKIIDGQLKIPTLDVKGFISVNEFEYLLPTRVFKVI